jgi:hypothetical protein
MSTVTVPAGLVGLLREAVEERFARAAEKLSGRVYSRSGWRIDVKRLEPFDAYRVLLESIGWKRTHRAAVEIDLSVHRWALDTALRERLDRERGLAKIKGRSPAGAARYKRALCNVEKIEAFMAGLGEEWKVKTPELDLSESARGLLRAHRVDPTDAHAVYQFAEKQAARGKRLVGPVPEERNLEILRLRILDGLTLREIGERTGLTGGRVGAILSDYFGVSGTPAAAKARTT